MQRFPAKNPPKKAKKRDPNTIRATKAIIIDSRHECMSKIEASRSWKTLLDRAKKKKIW